MEIDKQNITAVILAGGKGRRLEGLDKGLVLYKNKALIQHVIERIHSQVSSILINANRNQEDYKTYGYPVTSDEMSGFQGPLSGFSTAMKEVKTDYILTLPCDGPSLPLNLVSRMLSKLNNMQDTKNCILVAHDGIRIQPIHALIPVDLLDSLERFLANGERKVDLWYQNHQTVLVDFSDQPEAFFNINKKGQLNEK